MTALQSLRPTAKAGIPEAELISGEFMAHILTPYRDHCKYLKRAEFMHYGNDDIKSLVMEGDFGISDSCYIDDTGHFNAVEFNICYNQIAYLHLGYCIKNNLIPELAGYSFEEFNKKQLSNFLIANISSSYSSELYAKDFHGRFGINTIRKRSGCTFIKTYCQFNDHKKGRSKGEVTLAVLDP